MSGFTERDSPEIVKLLLAYGANTELADKDGFTPLMMAASTYGLDSLKVLIESGANVNVRNYSGATPLLASTIYGHANSVKLILESGKVKDIYETCSRGQTCFEYAVIEDRVDCLVVLLDFEYPKIMEKLLLLVLDKRNIECLKVLMLYNKEDLKNTLLAYIYHQYQEGIQYVIDKVDNIDINTLTLLALIKYDDLERFIDKIDFKEVTYTFIKAIYLWNVNVFNQILPKIDQIKDEKLKIADELLNIDFYKKMNSEGSSTALIEEEIASVESTTLLSLIMLNLDMETVELVCSNEKYFNIAVFKQFGAILSRKIYVSKENIIDSLIEILEKYGLKDRIAVDIQSQNNQNIDYLIQSGDYSAMRAYLYLVKKQNIGGMRILSYDAEVIQGNEEAAKQFNSTFKQHLEGINRFEYYLQFYSTEALTAVKKLDKSNFTLESKHKL